MNSVPAASQPTRLFGAKSGRASFAVAAPCAAAGATQAALPAQTRPSTRPPANARFIVIVVLDANTDIGVLLFSRFVSGCVSRRIACLSRRSPEEAASLGHHLLRGYHAMPAKRRMGDPADENDRFAAAPTFALRLKSASPRSAPTLRHRWAVK